MGPRPPEVGSNRKQEEGGSNIDGAGPGGFFHSDFSKALRARSLGDTARGQEKTQIGVGLTLLAKGAPFVSNTYSASYSSCILYVFSTDTMRCVFVYILTRILSDFGIHVGIHPNTLEYMSPHIRRLNTPRIRSEIR